MCASMAETTSADALTARLLRARLRRRRWLWWIAGSIGYICWDIIHHSAFGTFVANGGGHTLEWALATLIGLLLMLVISHRQDQYLVLLEVMERERTKTAQSLAQAEAVRATARTVAHTLNQPLAIIRGYAELFRDTPRDERDDTDLARIIDEVDQAADLVRQLLEISRFRTVPYAGGVPMLDLSEEQEK